MLEKLVLAVTVTFCLNLFLGVNVPSKTVTYPNYRIGETPTRLVNAANRAKISSLPAAAIPW